MILYIPKVRRHSTAKGLDQDVDTLSGWDHLYNKMADHHADRQVPQMEGSAPQKEVILCTLETTDCPDAGSDKAPGPPFPKPCHLSYAGCQTQHTWDISSAMLLIHLFGGSPNKEILT